MAVWHVRDKQSSQLKLFRKTDGTFQVVQIGAFGLILGGYDYILIDQSLLPAFKQLSSEQLEFKSAEIGYSGLICATYFG